MTTSNLPNLKEQAIELLRTTEIVLTSDLRTSGHARGQWERQYDARVLIRAAIHRLGEKV